MCDGGDHILYTVKGTKSVPRLREMNASATAPVSADAPVPGLTSLAENRSPTESVVAGLDPFISFPAARLHCLRALS